MFWIRWLLKLLLLALLLWGGAAAALLLATGGALGLWAVWMGFPALAGSGALLALLLLVLSRWLGWCHNRRRQGDYITYQGDGGEVRVSVRAVKDLIERTVASSTCVVSVVPEVYTGRRGLLAVEVFLRVTSEAAVPELCRTLQERIAACLSERLGMQDVAAIRVSVREILPRQGEGKALEGEP